MTIIEPAFCPRIGEGAGLTILGGAATIARSAASGTSAFRLVDVAPGASLTLRNLTLQGGLAASQSGAIYNGGTLALDGVTVQNNVARGAAGSYGAPLYRGAMRTAGASSRPAPLRLPEARSSTTRPSAAAVSMPRSCIRAPNRATAVASSRPHLVGVHHTEFSFENSVMDKDIRVPMGPDLVFGTPDDVNMQFGIDAYDPRERYQGVHDTINTMAFALSTGRTAAAPSSIAALAATPQTAAIRVFLDARQVEFSTAPPNTRVWSLVDSPVDEEEASLPPS